MSGNDFGSEHLPLQQHDQSQQRSRSQVIDLGSSDSETKTTSEPTLAQKLKKKGTRKDHRGPGSKKRKKKGKKLAISSEAVGGTTARDGSNQTTTDLSAKTSFSTVDTVLINGDDGTTLPSVVPVLPRFELEEIAHGGDIHEVAIANDVINSGDRLICEAPTIAVRDPTDVEAIYEAFGRLTPQDQEAIWRLKATPAPHLQKLATHTKAMIEYVWDLYTKGNAGRTEEEEKQLDELEPLLESYCKTWRLAARFSHNCYSLTNLPPSERHEIPISEPLSGLFPTVAKLQHSCMPNCHVTYNRAIGKMTVHAVREIKEGEPLTISNIGTDVYYLQNAADRAQRLHDVSSPPCNCPACDTANPRFPALNRVRGQVYARAQWLSATLSKMDTGSNSNLRNPVGLENCVAPSQGAFSGLQTGCEEILDYLRKTGCHDVEQIRWRQPLIIALQKQGRTTRAIGAAKANVELAKTCWGVDNPDYLGLKEELRKMEEAAWTQVTAGGSSKKGKGK